MFTLRGIVVSLALILTLGLTGDTAWGQFRVKPVLPEPVPPPLPIMPVLPAPTLQPKLSPPPFVPPPTITPAYPSNPGYVTGSQPQPPVQQSHDTRNTKSQPIQSHPVVGGPPPKPKKSGGDDGGGDDGGATDDASNSPNSQPDDNEDEPRWRQTLNEVPAWLSRQPDWLLCVLGAATLVIIIIVLYNL